MITLQCLLEFQNKQDKEIVLDLMRRFSLAIDMHTKDYWKVKKEKI